MLTTDELELLARPPEVHPRVTAVHIDPKVLAWLAKRELERRWIPVSERMPERYDWVIAYDEVGTTKSYFWEEAKRWIRDNGDELYAVTHWQPLPSPPSTDNT